MTIKLKFGHAEITILSLSISLVDEAELYADLEGPVWDETKHNAAIVLEKKLEASAMHMLYGARAVPAGKGPLIDAEPVVTVGGIKWRVGP